MSKSIDQRIQIFICFLQRLFFKFSATKNNPATSPECLRYVMGDFDLALVMTVNPGFGGQKLIPGCVRKIAEIRRMLDEAGCDAIIEVDGGVNTQTAPMLMEAGATMLVAGSALYGAPDAKAFIDTIRGQYAKIGG